MTFECDGDELVGILHVPDGNAQPIGVLIVVGGPQYRVGSHRQFVQLARAVSAAGYSTFRFDYRGMGDSEGICAGFENVNADIHAAVDTFLREQPGVTDVAIFGLCDAASAAMMYGGRDDRIAGMILANPWVHSERGQARAYVQRYYMQRLLQVGFWRKFLSGRFDLVGSLIDFTRKLARSAMPRPETAQPFIDQMRQGLTRFRGRVLFLISGRDLTAAEFLALCAGNPAWKALVSRAGTRTVTLVDADHTFSARNASNRVEQLCIEWLHGLGKGGSNHDKSAA